MAVPSSLTRREVVHQFGRLVCAAPLLTLVGCNELAGEGARFGFAGSTMGTSYRITTKGHHAPAHLQAGVEAILESTNQQLSTYRTNSDLSRFNRTAGSSWLEVPPELAHVLTTADGISRASGGAFDATVAPVVDLWGFGPSASIINSPSDHRLGAALAKIGHHQLHINDAQTAVRKARPDVTVDLSGIAKGFAVDRIADYLERHGVDDFLIDIGGDMRMSRSSPSNAPWRIGIERPEIGPRTVHRVINIGQGAVATSGDYRNFLESNGSMYSHIIDPRSGAPVSHDLASVAVVAGTAEQADGLSTALMVMGPDAGLELANDIELSALFIVRKGGRLVDLPSRQFNRYLVA
jgi:thiamine biosynthesis lipoprotein